MNEVGYKRSERGQVLVLIVLAVVALLGFTALAVDGSMVYANRRQIQNSADAASLGGGGRAAMILENMHVTDWTWTCTLTGVLDAQNQARTVAAARAGDNGFVLNANDLDLSDRHGITTQCGMDTSSGWPEKFIDIRVMLTGDSDASFSQFVFKGPLRNSVEAITRVRPRTNAGFGHAIVGLNPSLCSGNSNGVIVNGSLDVNVDGGGIFSNGCLSGTGTSSDVTVTNGSISYVSQFIPGNTNWNPNPAAGSPMPLDAYDIDPPDCSQVPNFGNPSNAFSTGASGYIPAGNYTRINMNGNVTLQGGGLYCMNGDFDTGNVDVSITPSGGKTGVTIYLKSGDFITGGNGSVVLTAPPFSPDPFPAVPGLLVYLARGNSGLAKLRGNAGSYFQGTIFVPDGNIDQAGTPDAQVFASQLIGKNVVISGKVKLDVYYTANMMYQIPTRLFLYR